MTVARRLSGFVLLLVLAGSWAFRGHCVMPELPAAATPSCHEVAPGPPTDGLRAAASACCHADLVADLPATTKKAAELVAILAPAAAVLPPPEPPHDVAPAASARTDGSSPPVTVLRI